MKKNIYYVIFFLVLCVASCSFDSGSRNDQGALAEFFPLNSSRAYNILIISFDSLRADALGVYGYRRATSPNIDKFAQGAVVFDNAHSAGATTPSSFASAFSGRLPFRSLIGGRLRAEQSLASILGQDGYKTAFVSNNVQLVGSKGFEIGFGEYHVDGRNNDDGLLRRSLELLDSLGRGRFFAWFHFLSPHVPYSYRPGSEHLYDPAYHGPYEKDSGLEFYKKPENISDVDLRQLRNLYDGEVYYADSIFRKVLDHCEQLGILENTIVVVTADHGEEFKDHGGLGHKVVYEEGVHIPLIIRHPGALKAGRTAVPYLNIDLLPTVAALVGARIPAGVDGMNLLAEKVAEDRKRVSVCMAAPAIGLEKISLRQGRYKLIRYCEGPTDYLFDLADDPLERTDLSRRAADGADA